MEKYEIMDNAFWEDGCDDRSVLKCIRIYQPDAQGRRKKSVFQFRNKLTDGSECPNYREVVTALGIQKIDANTTERRTRKEREGHEAKARMEQEKQTKELEHLFGLKLRAFEVDLIKNSENKAMRTKLRRAQNEIEMNAIATLIVGEELGYFKNERTD